MADRVILLIKGEEGAGGAESLETEGWEGGDEVEVANQERILSGSN